jgi:uncharacterized membrane protein
MAMIVLTAVFASVIFLGALFALFFVITRGTRTLFGPRRRLEAEMGLDAFRARLARGEITAQEFEQAKGALGA